MTDINENLSLATKNLRDQLNEKLQSLGAPQVGLSTSDRERSETYTEFNEWLIDANENVLKTLVNQFGITPALFALTGLNLDQVAYLQDRPKADLTGPVRYLKTLWENAVEKNAKHTKSIVTLMFGSQLHQDDDQDEWPAQFIATVLEYLINTENNMTYEEAMERILELTTPKA